VHLQYLCAHTALFCMKYVHIYGLVLRACVGKSVYDVHSAWVSTMMLTHCAVQAC
jgi:hypothetical protein